MANLSKILHYSCYELGHTWEPSCIKATADIAYSGYTESFKIYLPVYLLTAILRKKGKDYYLKKLLPEVLQSAVFLGTNAVGFISSFCIWRQLFGCFTYLNGFLPGLTSSYVAILLERKSRRGLLALYMSNIASELVWNMMTSRGIIKPIHNGEIYLFCVISAIYMYLFRRRNGLDKSLSSALGLLVGTSEKHAVETTAENRRSLSGDAALARRRQADGSDTSAAGSPDVDTGAHRVSTCRRRTDSITSQIQHLIRTCRQHIRDMQQHIRDIQYPAVLQLKHRTCSHRYGCILSTLSQSGKMFGLGYSVQTVMNLMGMIPRIVKKPSLLRRVLFHKLNFQLAAFLASFSAIFKLVNCALRWLIQRDDELYGLVSGFLAGFSMLWFKSSAITLYLGAKLVEILYFKGIARGSLPHIRCGDIIIYSLSTALVFHAAVFEPHNIRPQYWNFLLRLTHGHFGEMNRNLMMDYGSNANKMYKDFWPNYDPKYTDLKCPFK